MQKANRAQLVFCLTVAAAFWGMAGRAAAQTGTPPAASPPAPAAAPAKGGEAPTPGFRRFTMTDGKMIYALIESKADTAVNFRLQNGRKTSVPLRSLSEVDQNFVRKWSPFKDQLLQNAEFSKLTVKELLEYRGYQTFEFDINGNHIFVEGELNGKPAKFMIDTGAASSLVHLKSAEDAGLQVGPMTEKIYGVAGEAPAGVVRVPTLKMGDAVMKNRKLLATDLFKDFGGEKTYDGIFGADFLRELNAAISYREGRVFLWVEPEAAPAPAAATGALAGAGVAAITGAKPEAAVAAAGQKRQEFRRWTSSDGRTMFGALEDKTETDAMFRLQNGAKAKVPINKLSEEDQAAIAKWSKLREALVVNPEFRKLTMRELLELRGYQSFQYRPVGNHILVDGKANDTAARFLIDTGAGGAVFHIDFAKKANLEVGPMDQVIMGIGGSAPAALCKVKTLKIGDAVFQNREVLAADLERQQKAFGASHDAIFGADFLRELDAVISYKEGLMFLRPQVSDLPPEPPAKPKKDAAGQE